MLGRQSLLLMAFRLSQAARASSTVWTTGGRTVGVTSMQVLKDQCMCINQPFQVERLDSTMSYCYAGFRRLQRYLAMQRPGSFLDAKKCTAQHLRLLDLG